MTDSPSVDHRDVALRDLALQVGQAAIDKALAVAQLQGTIAALQGRLHQLQAEVEELRAQLDADADDDDDPADPA